VLGFIGHDPGKGNARSIIDGDVDVFPSSAFDQIASVAGNAVTWALNAGELFDVEVDELAWVSALVAPCRGRRIEQSQAMELVATQDARDTRLGEGALACDLKAWHAQSAERERDGHLSWWYLAWATMRTRGVITQSGASLGPKTGHPFAGGAFAHGECRRGGLCREPSVNDGQDKSFSTPRGQSSISMDVHALGLSGCLV
jgi:hypothetical protein